MKLVTNGRLITRNASAQGYYEHGAVALVSFFFLKCSAKVNLHSG